MECCFRNNTWASTIWSPWAPFILYQLWLHLEGIGWSTPQALNMWVKKSMDTYVMDTYSIVYRCTTCTLLFVCGVTLLTNIWIVRLDCIQNPEISVAVDVTCQPFWKMWEGMAWLVAALKWLEINLCYPYDWKKAKTGKQGLIWKLVSLVIIVPHLTGMFLFSVLYQISQQICYCLLVWQLLISLQLLIRHLHYVHVA